MRVRSKPFTLFLTLALLAWLMPLGSFIRSSQEKTACGGKRAFHMCSMMSGKAQKPSDGKIAFSNASASERTAKSSASGGDDFTAETPRLLVQIRKESAVSEKALFYVPFTPDRHDPPPRALTLL